MESLDLLQEENEYTNIYDYYEFALCQGEYISLENGKWHDTNHGITTKFEHQIKRDMVGLWKYEINGIKFNFETCNLSNQYTKSRKELNNEYNSEKKIINNIYSTKNQESNIKEFENKMKIINDKFTIKRKNIIDIEYNKIFSYIKEYNLTDNQLKIFKYCLTQSETGDFMQFFLKIFNPFKYSFISDCDPNYAIKYIYIYNNNINIIIESSLSFGIRLVDENLKIGNITYKKYINLNEDKVIVSIEDVEILEYYDHNIDELISLKKKVNIKKGLMIDYTFYKIINLDLQRIFDIYMNKNSIEVLIEKVKASNLSKNIQGIIYKINNIKLSNLKIMLDNNLIGKFSQNSITSNNINALQNKNFTKETYDIEHQKILFLLTDDSYNVLLDFLKRSIFLGKYEYKDIRFSLGVNPEKPIEKNFFIYDNIIYITEYYFDIIVMIGEEPNNLGIIYVYNIVDFANNTYKINFYIKSINIRNFLTLKFTLKGIPDVNKVLNNIIELYDNNFIKLKMNTIINKININRINTNENSTLNSVLDKITKTLPNLEKNHFSIKKSDVLLISFNENRKVYNYNDCLPIIVKILIGKPKIIIICTQETVENMRNAGMFKGFTPVSQPDLSYQVIFREIVNLLGYKEKSPPTGRSFLNKALSRLGSRPSNKTKIYFNRDTPNSYSEPVIKLHTTPKYNISTIDFSSQEIPHKIAIVNCNLSIKSSDTVQFQQMLNDKAFITLNRDYDIFFCGDINLKFIIEKKNVNSHNVLKENLRNINQFYTVFKFENKSSIHTKLLDSITCLGSYLTSPYFIGQYKKEIELYSKIYNGNNGNNTNNSQILNIKNSHNIGAIELVTDRILYALKNDSGIEIKREDFNVHFFPDKSSHKMLSLTFDLNTRKRRNMRIVPQVSRNENVLVSYPNA